MKVTDILKKIKKEDIERAINSFVTNPYNRKGKLLSLIYDNNFYPVRELVMRASENELKNRETQGSYTVNDAKKTLIKLGYNDFNTTDEKLINPNNKMHFYKIVKQQDIDGEFFVPVKMKGIFDFFPDPRNLKSTQIPSKLLLVNNWIKITGENDILIKKYTNDVRIGPTPNIDKSLVENSILKFEKLNENTYNISLIDSSNSDYGDLLKRIIDEGYKKSYLIEGNSIKIEEVKAKREQTSEPLNQIFFGPPGTGKTYKTITTALDIIGIDYKDYADAEEKFRLELGKRIEFVTMHQSYSYEDFIQGLKPKKTEDGKGILFVYINGVFKEVCKRADLYRKEFGLVNSEDRIDFEVVYNYSFNPLFDDGESIIIERGKTKFVIYEFSDKTLWFETSNGTIHPRYTLAKKTLKKIYDSKINNIIKSGNKGYFDATLDFLLENEKRILENKKEINPNQNLNHVIILDEINRANISRVFGELIALIEVNKRDGRLTATLPSGELFSVPSNLYVIGTMNTADKSIALVDIALRRRFKFKALYPNLETLKSVLTDKKMDKHEISKRIEILKRLNKLIRSKKSVDFEIGHSYFMEDDKLENILNSQILPLLNEYFMYDLKAVKNLIENQHKDILGNNIPKTGIIFDKAVYNERGLLEVEKIDFKGEDDANAIENTGEVSVNEIDSETLTEV